MMTFCPRLSKFGSVRTLVLLIVLLGLGVAPAITHGQEACGTPCNLIQNRLVWALEDVQTALEEWLSVFGTYPEDLESLLPDYLPSLPYAGMAYDVAYTKTDAPLWFKATATSRAPGITGSGAGDDVWTLEAGAFPENTVNGCVNTFACPGPPACEHHCRQFQWDLWTFLTELSSALEMWATDHHGNYPAELALLVPDYIASLNPPEIASYALSYAVETSPNWYTVTATSRYPGITANGAGDSIWTYTPNGLLDGVVDCSDVPQPICNPIPPPLPFFRAAVLTSGYETSALFGWSVAVDDDVAVIGDPADDAFGSSAGTAHVFRYNGCTWVFETVLTAIDTGAGDEFGYAVAVDGNAIAVGAPGDDERGESAGAVHVFRHNGTVWSEEVKLTADDGAGNDNLGLSVDVDGALIVAGAPQRDSFRGGVYAFIHNGGSWEQESVITPNDPEIGKLFGWSVAAHETWLLAGAPYDSEQAQSAGAAYAFVYTYGSVIGVLEWQQRQKYTAYDGAAGDNFGWSVDIGDRGRVVGAIYHENSGAAYVFGSGLDMKFLPEPGANNTDFGWAVAMDGRRVAVGAPNQDGGRLYLFEYSGTNGFWNRRLVFGPGRGLPGGVFGTSVAMSKEIILGGGAMDETAMRVPVFRQLLFPAVAGTFFSEDIGASETLGVAVDVDGDVAVAFDPASDGAENGAIRIFRRIAGGWAPEDALLPDIKNEATPTTFRNAAISISGDTIVVGLPADGTTGSAHVFRRGIDGWNQEAELTPEDGSVRNFGWSAAIDGDTVVVGAVGERTPGTAGGQVFVFERVDTTWSETAQLVPGDGTSADHFGFSVALSGNRAVVGGWYHDEGAGFAAIFEETGGTWSERTRLYVENEVLKIGGNPNRNREKSHLGWAVAIRGDTLAVSAVIGGGPDANSGAVYVARWTGSAWEAGPRFAIDEWLDWFGISLALDGDRLYVGVPQAMGYGGAHVFQSTDGLEWTQAEPLLLDSEAAAGGSQIDVAAQGNTSILSKAGSYGSSGARGVVRFYGIGAPPPPAARCKHLTVEADDDCRGTVSTLDVDDGSSDPEGGPIALCLDPPGPYALGDTLLTLTVTDDKDSLDICTARIQVIDVTQPVVECPDDIRVATDPGQCSAVVTFADPTSTDNCSVASTSKTDGPASGSAFPVGDTRIAFTVADSSSNSSACDFLVTVIDNENPNCPAGNIEVEPSGPAGATVIYPAPVGVDNCAGVTITHMGGLGSGATFPIGITSETFTATDASGNSTSCAFTVRVLSPVEVSTKLIEKIDALGMSGTLKKRQTRRLRRKLKSIIAKLEFGRRLKPASRNFRVFINRINGLVKALACRKLSVFIYQIHGLVRARQLTETEGEELIDSAINIGKGAGCSGRLF